MYDNGQVVLVGITQLKVCRLVTHLMQGCLVVTMTEMQLCGMNEAQVFYLALIILSMCESIMLATWALGTAPATDWHANYSVLQLGGQAGIWTHKAVGAGKALHISHNAEYDTGFKFIANDEATLYYQGDGAHRFSHGAYGTAGSAISFVERLKIDADGLTFQGNTGGGATALTIMKRVLGRPRFG